VVGEACESPSHWSSGRSLAAWMEEEGVPGIQGLDTRALAKIIRQFFFPSNLGGLLTNSAGDPDSDSVESLNPNPDPDCETGSGSRRA
jgi:carbamoylphosphate synthase small subunit